MDRDETETFDFWSETRPRPSQISPRPRRDRDVEKKVSRPSRDRGVETETTSQVITGTDAEIHAVPFFGRHLGFQLNATVYKIADTTIKKFDPENMGVAAGISFLSALELEIPLVGKSPPLSCIIRM